MKLKFFLNLKNKKKLKTESTTKDKKSQNKFCKKETKKFDGRKKNK